MNADMSAAAARTGGVRSRSRVVERPRLDATAKRALDASLAGVGLIASLPLWAAIAAAIKLEDRGPIFYGQERVGRGGRVFFVW